jgi:uncharacterized membrane protein
LPRSLVERTFQDGLEILVDEEGAKACLAAAANRAREGAASPVAQSRIESIDLLRGFVMILMALDHIRDWFHFDSLLFSPTDLQRTTPALFATRWITHLCAPTFILLAGSAAYFISRRKTPRDTASFLLTRGAWLVLLQLTLVRFAWNFDPGFHYDSSSIISTIGFCMMGLAMLIPFRLRTLLAIGAAIVVGHNAFDAVSFPSGSLLDVLWSFLHVHKLYTLSHGYVFLFLYPIVPWIGVMVLGYCLGHLYDPDVDSKSRKRLLLAMGLGSLLGSLALRWLNVYGDPSPWARQPNPSGTIMSFFNLEKYPPSLIYLGATLGIALLFLGSVDGLNLERWRPVTLFGRVALFYYVLHLFVIHLSAVAAVVLTGYPWSTMVFRGSPNEASPLLAGHFGFNLPGVYLVWLGIVALLYPCCRYWAALKARNKAKWWVSYV